MSAGRTVEFLDQFSRALALRTLRSRRSRRNSKRRRHSGGQRASGPRQSGHRRFSIDWLSEITDEVSGEFGAERLRERVADWNNNRRTRRRIRSRARRQPVSRFRNRSTLSAVLRDTVSVRDILWLLATLVALALFILSARTLHDARQAIRQAPTTAPATGPRSSTSVAVRHFEAGVVQKVLVSEGDTVDEGQVLLVLKSDAGVADIAKASASLVRRRLNQARLLAVMGDLETITWPEFEFPVNQKLVDHEKERQIRLFDAGLAYMKASVESVEARRRKAEATIAALESEQQVLDVYREVLAEESTTRSEQLKKGQIAEDYARTVEQRLVAAEQASVVLHDSLERHRAELDNAVFRREALRQLRIKSAKSDYLKEEHAIAGSSRALAQRQNKLTRSRILAPVAGRIVSMAEIKPGFAIKPGEWLLGIDLSAD